MCHTDQHRTEGLHLVLPGICMTFKQDLQASVSELAYSKLLRIPSKLLFLATNPVNPAHLITELRQHMAHLRPVLAAHYANPRYIRAQQPREVHTHLPPSGHKVQGFGVPYTTTTRSSHGERKYFSPSWVAGLSPCQPTGSSQPTC